VSGNFSCDGPCAFAHGTKIHAQADGK